MILLAKILNLNLATPFVPPNLFQLRGHFSLQNHTTYAYDAPCFYSYFNFYFNHDNISNEQMKRCSNQCFPSHAQTHAARPGVGAWNSNPLASMVEEAHYDLPFNSLNSSTWPSCCFKFTMSCNLVLHHPKMQVGTTPCVVPTTLNPGGDMSLMSYTVPSLLRCIDDYLQCRIPLRSSRIYSAAAVRSLALPHIECYYECTYGQLFTKCACCRLQKLKRSRFGAQCARRLYLHTSVN